MRNFKGLELDILSLMGLDPSSFNRPNGLRDKVILATLVNSKRSAYNLFGDPSKRINPKPLIELDTEVAQQSEGTEASSLRTTDMGAESLGSHKVVFNVGRSDKFASKTKANNGSRLWKRDARRFASYMRHKVF